MSMLLIHQHLAARPRLTALSAIMHRIESQMESPREDRGRVREYSHSERIGLLQ